MQNHPQNQRKEQLKRLKQTQEAVEFDSFMTDAQMQSGGSEGAHAYGNYAEPSDQMLLEGFEEEIPSGSDNSNAGRNHSSLWKKGEKEK